MNTIARDIDALSIVNIKIFMLENIKRDSNASDSQVAEATRKTNNLNSERNALIDSIDVALNKIAAGDQQQLFGSNKMYGNEKQ